jgi:hydrogenase-4 component F
MTIILGIFSAAIITLLLLKNELTIRRLGNVSALLVAIAVVYQVMPQLTGGEAVVNNWLFVDGFSALMATLIVVLYLFASLVSFSYLAHEKHEGIVTDRDIKLYYILLQLFVLSMLTVVLTNQTLVMWLSLEATTLASTFLVGLYRKKTSIEAAWKYIIICSTGITLGLIGILLLGFGANQVGELSTSTFLLSTLMLKATIIPVKLVKLAFVFIFIGFGAKVGFVPTHTWLPDAHGNAPSPISALFSGILLNVALYAIVRFQLVADRALGGHTWTGLFFLTFGVLSIVLPALMMLIQNNYKRMLAYSSIEHMGLISIGLALPPIGTIAAIIHITAHAFIKSSLFFGAGEILLRYKTTHADKIRGLLVNAPYTAILFVLGILAIIAIPPSALFVSEYSLFAILIKTHLILSAFIFVSLSIIAYAMLKVTLGMVMSPAEPGKVEVREKWNLTHSIITGELLAVVVLTFWFSSFTGQKFVMAIASKLY